MVVDSGVSMFYLKKNKDLDVCKGSVLLHFALAWTDTYHASYTIKAVEPIALNFIKTVY